MKITIERAIDRYDLAHEYYLNHIKVLQHYNVDGVSSMNAGWKYNPQIIMITAHCEETNKMIGAVRLEVAGGFHELPMENAIKSTGNNISNLVKQLSINGGVAELSGLWTSPSYKKENLAFKLMRAAIKFTKTIRINSILGFANEYSKPATEELGFSHLESIDNNGIYYYPTEKYKTYVMHKSHTKIKIPNIVEMENVNN